MKGAARLVTTSLSRCALRTSTLRPCLVAHAGPSRVFSTSPLRCEVQKANVIPVEEAREEATVEEEDALEEARVEALEDAQDEAMMDAALAESNPVFHKIPNSVLDPILLPLSSLASSRPAEAAQPLVAVSLPPDIFGQRIRRDILHRCVVWYRSTMRQGTHKTKNRSELAYSGKKMRPQKKTGRARLGDKSSPHLRGGAHAHAKRPRDYAQDLPRKERAIGMNVALSAKLQMGLLRVVQKFNDAPFCKTARTKDAKQRLSQGYGRKDKLNILFIHSPLKPVADVVEFARPLRNIPGVEIMSADEVEVYHLLKHRWVVMEGDAIDAIQAHKGQAQPVELLEKPTPGRRIVRPGRWLVHSWRKQRGSKSMRKTFGTKNATAREVAAKRMWKRLRRLGMDQTPDNVNVLLNMRKASVAA